MLIQSVVELIGNTPLIELKGYDLPTGTKIFAKLEMFNPGGSIKDRLGQKLIEAGLASGEITKDTVIIEPTAGNTGIGLALVASHYGLKTKFVIPTQFSKEKQIILAALGSEIIPSPAALGIKGAIEVAKKLAAATPNSYLPLQFANDLNPLTYYETLGPEIYAELAGEVTSFVAGAGSGGTFAGVGKYLKEQNPEIRLAVVEPVGSILNGGPAHTHRIEGIGVEFIPDFFKDIGIDEIYTISDEDGFQAVADLALKTGLLVGSSSGAAFIAALAEARTLPPGSQIVTIFPDSSERYLSKNIY